MMSLLTVKIEDELSPIVKEFDCRIVRIAIFKKAKSKTLQIMIEKIDETLVTIDDCQKVSRAVSVCLDVMNPISGQYNLEISSTGIDRPLVKIEDYIKFVGKSVVIKTYSLKNERKLFKGVLASASENGIQLELDSPLIDGSLFIDLVYDEISSSHINGLKSGK